MHIEAILSFTLSSSIQCEIPYTEYLYQLFLHHVLDRNSAELNKLRSEYAGLMKELADNNGKLQHEEHQRKSLEVSYKQNVSQLEVC